MIFADLHIHIGQSLDGKYVKITGAKTLTLPNILQVAREVKGLSLVGIVDSHSPGVQGDFKTLLASGVLKPLSTGGYAANGLAVIPGHEIELQVGEGNAHFLAYFPYLEQVEQYVRSIKNGIKNWQLSTQRGFLPIDLWLEAVTKAEGLWFPAHAFTPHKGIYGACCRRLRDVLPILPKAVEIGLSADRAMAKSISELDSMVMFSNSDAHSLPNIAREYNSLARTDPSFGGLLDLIIGKSKQAVRNYGLPPRVGKYHRTYCLSCEKVIKSPAPQLMCPDCGSKQVVMGVLDRLVSIADRPLGKHDVSTYVHQVPLRQLPGIGPKMYERLLSAFGTEMTILHQVNMEELRAVAGEKVAAWIIKDRYGELIIEAGGGGVFGRVVDILSPEVE
ncbi:endonuclease Q family protein [Desulfosporosinus shakirovi]|uniref:endonuclease Q family protein n=1 Tax=Desulfosporosinus shakirovi TaxID=2885154 RepID=UPI001E54313B|nr:endonuclease Q family protein [Desulfosporosinus sp. SRJS8]MCB8816476.1 endonuclease Q family protein [Desulfosporosinus sp. SRJS8]